MRFLKDEHGNDQLKIRTPFIITTSLRQYCEIFSRNLDARELSTILDRVKIRRMQQGSAYWLYVHDGVRYIFTVKRHEEEGPRTMILVTVQLDNRTNDVHAARA